MKLAYRSVTLLAICGTMLSACAERDTDPPLITVFTPQENAPFAVLDTVPVAYQVTDERIVESVTVKLVNQNFIPVSGQVTQTIGKASHNGFAELIIDNRQLESGKYYVLLTATDGTNDRNAYRSVHVAALPFERRAVYFADMQTQGNSGIYKVDSLFSSITPFISGGQDIGRVLVHSADNRITLAGIKGTGITQYDLLGSGQRWATSANNQPPAPTFHDMATDGKNIFLSLFTRELRGYSMNGALILNRQFEHDRPHTLYADDQHLLVELREVGGGQNRLMVLRQNNFSEKWLVTLPMQTVAICPRTSSEVFIFGNDGGQARVLLYNTETNGWWEPRQLPSGRILHAVKGDGQTYFLALESGLYAYTYSPNYLNTLRAGEQLQRLRFDRADALLMGASGNSLKVIAPQNGAVIATMSHTDSITDLDIHYTK
jgi:hypothetical protein